MFLDEVASHSHLIKASLSYSYLIDSLANIWLRGGAKTIGEHPLSSRR